MRRTKSDFDPRDGLAAEVAVPEPERPIDAPAVNQDNTWGSGGSINLLSKAEKK